MTGKPKKYKKGEPRFCVDCGVPASKRHKQYSRRHGWYWVYNARCNPCKKAWKVLTYPRCELAGCDNETASKKNPLCQTHYGRRLKDPSVMEYERDDFEGLGILECTACGAPYVEHTLGVRCPVAKAAIRYRTKAIA